MSDGDQIYLNKSQLPRRAPEAVAPVSAEAQPEALELLPHQFPRQFTNGIIRLRVIRQRDTLGDPKDKSWDAFEEVGHGKRV